MSYLQVLLTCVHTCCQTWSSPTVGGSFSYSPDFAFCDLGNVVSTFAGEDWGKNLSVPHILGNYVSPFLPERAHIFPVCTAPVLDISLAQDYEPQQTSMWLLLELDSLLTMESQAGIDTMKSLMENNEAHQSPGNNMIGNLSLTTSQSIYLINWVLHPN